MFFVIIFFIISCIVYVKRNFGSGTSLGIMPITNKKQLRRSMELSGTAVPQRFLAIIDRFGDDPEAMKQAGIAYATDQIIDLIANGINHIHVYSMNKPDVAAAIMNNLSAILKVED